MAQTAGPDCRPMGSMPPAAIGQCRARFINVQTGGTLLYPADRHGNTVLVKLLLSCGASPQTALGPWSNPLTLEAAPCRLGHGASGRLQVAWRRQGGSVFDRRAAIAETVRTLPAEYSNAGWPAIVPPPKHCTRAGWPPATYEKSPLNFGRPRPTKVGIAGADTS